VTLYSYFPIDLNRILSVRNFVYYAEVSRPTKLKTAEKVHITVLNHPGITIKNLCPQRPWRAQEIPHSILKSNIWLQRYAAPHNHCHLLVPNKTHFFRHTQSGQEVAIPPVYVRSHRTVALQSIIGDNHVVYSCKAAGRKTKVSEPHCCKHSPNLVCG
jgi:hypothetical protein